MRTLLLNTIFFLFLSSFFYSCEEDPDPPVADFSVTQVDSSGDIYVKFKDMSTNSPDHWEWKFEGGFPKTSEEQNPTIVYKEPGIFDVELIASNEGGSNEIIKYAHINVARMINNMPTEADVSFNGQIKTVPSKSYVHFVMIDKFQTGCHVETSGKNTNGEQVGLLIYWDIAVNIEDYYFYEFGYGPEVAFFNVTNNSNYSFTHFHAHVNDKDLESLEEIVIPNDGKKHGIGYYIANSEMEIRTYFPEGYIYWIEGYNFLIPWENNQSVDLRYGESNKTVFEDLEITYKSSNIGYSYILNNRIIQESTNPNTLFVGPSGIK